MPNIPWMNNDYVYVLDKEKQEKLLPVMVKLAEFVQENTEGPYEAYALLHEMLEYIKKYANIDEVDVGHLPSTGE